MPTVEDKSEEIKKSQEENDPNKVKKDTDKALDKVKEEEDEDKIKVVKDAYTINEIEKIGAQNAKKLMTHMAGGIFGMPYQFSPEVDTILEGTDFGRKYVEQVVSNMPILFLAPGKTLYMPGYTYDEKEGVLNLLANSDNDNVSEASTEDLLSGGNDGRYYAFDSDFPEFCKYVDTAVRALSLFMGISGESVYDHYGGMKLGDFSLARFSNTAFSQIFNANVSVPFYLDSDNSVSENFSNDSKESMLSQANQFSDIANEVSFILGDHDAGKLVDIVKGVAGGVIDFADNFTRQLGFGNRLIKNVAGQLSTVLTGGKMIFPEIWASSGYSKSYNISMKFRSPDADPVSIMTNVYIPTIILTSMTAGRQIDKSGNAYGMPFLVRATYKSIFNCELGLISSLDITKGGENRWNSRGMPTAIDVQLSIKDLYSNMFISKDDGFLYSALLNNMSQLDWLSLMAGLDMNKADYSRLTKLKAYLTTSGILNAPINAWTSFTSGVNKSVNNFLGNLGMDTRFIR